MRTTPHFWLVVLRRAIPVVDVGALGWAGASVAVFFLLESWLFLTVRSAVEITFDPHYSPGADRRSGAATARALVAMLLVTGIGFAILVPGIGGAIALFAMEDEASQRFLAGGWRNASFLAGVAGLLLDGVIDGVSFARRLAHRTAEQRQHDDQRVRVMFYRNVALLSGVMLVAMASAFGAPALGAVTVISVVLAVFELRPEYADRLAGRATTR